MSTSSRGKIACLVHSGVCGCKRPNGPEKFVREWPTLCQTPADTRGPVQILSLYTDADPNNRQDWPRQHRWLLNQLERFQSVFGQRVKSLRASDYRG